MYFGKFSRFGLYGPAAEYVHGPSGWAPVEDPRALDVARPW